MHKGWGKNVSIHELYKDRYATAYNDRAVVDGLRGTNSYWDGMWQGYEGNDINLTIDLGAEQKVSRISASFLQDHRSWIFFPESVLFSVSDDGKSFRPIS